MVGEITLCKLELAAEEDEEAALLSLEADFLEEGRFRLELGVAAMIERGCCFLAGESARKGRGVFFAIAVNDDADDDDAKGADADADAPCCC